MFDYKKNWRCWPRINLEKVLFAWRNAAENLLRQWEKTYSDLVESLLKKQFWSKKRNQNLLFCSLLKVSRISLKRVPLASSYVACSLLLGERMKISSKTDENYWKFHFYCSFLGIFVEATDPAAPWCLLPLSLFPFRPTLKRCNLILPPLFQFGGLKFRTALLIRRMANFFNTPLS